MGMREGTCGACKHFDYKGDDEKATATGSASITGPMTGPAATMSWI